MGVVTTSGCISSDGGNSTFTTVNSSVNYYNGSQVSFDIPSSWTMYTFLDPWATFAMKNSTPDEIGFLMMISFDAEANMSAQDILMQTMNSGQTIISQKNLTVDNASAYQIVTSDTGSTSSTYMIETVIIKNNRVYLIIVATDPLSLNQTQIDLDFILNSTKIK
jgi:hypothetical protein